MSSSHSEPWSGYGFWAVALLGDSLVKNGTHVLALCLVTKMLCAPYTDARAA